MQPTTFPQAYIKPLGAGDNPNTGDLPFVRAIDRNTPGRVFLISAWQPTEEERARIAAGGPVYVGVMASPLHPTQPPICVMGADPFSDYSNPFVAIEYGAPIPVPSGFRAALEDPDKVPAGIYFNDEIFREAQVEQIIQDANAQVESRPDLADKGEQIFPESNGIEPAKEIKLDPRSADFEIENTGKDFNVKKARTFTEEATGKTLAAE